MKFHIERIFKGPGFAETLYLGVCGGQRIIRKTSNPDAYDFSRIALAREIRLLRSLPENLHPFFPELIRTNFEGSDDDLCGFPGDIYYDMPYYAPEDGWKTLSRCLLDGALERLEAYRIIGEILDTAFVYFSIDTRIPDDDYPETTMFRAIRESCEWAWNDPDFQSLISLKNMHLNGRPVRNVPELTEYFQNTFPMRNALTPYRDRFLHGDFFPENILYNSKTGHWLLLDPVSVRGVHRGDFILDINKMDDWLTGELPALRLGQFNYEINDNYVDFTIHTGSGELEYLRRLGLSEFYRERLHDSSYAGLFTSEQGWELRYPFVKAFYAFCMLPLADKRQAIARYFLALQSMNDFLERFENG